MAYVDLDTDVCKNDFNIFSSDSTLNFKIIYLAKHRHLGVLSKITAHIPTQTPFIKEKKSVYKEFGEHADSYVDEIVENKIFNTLHQLYKNCFTPIYAKPSTTIKNKYYYKIYSTNKKLYYPEPLIIKKTKKNIWEVSSGKRRYMDIIYNYGQPKYTDEPDNVRMFLPHYNSVNISYVNDSPFELYKTHHGISCFKNRTPTFNYSLNNYVMKFRIRGGICSEKNSCIIRAYQDEDHDSYMESLRLSKNIIAVAYATPFSTLHAFSYGLSRLHPSKNRPYF